MTPTDSLLSSFASLFAPLDLRFETRSANVDPMILPFGTVGSIEFFNPESDQK
jgi:hypothetical protein